MLVLRDVPFHTLCQLPEWLKDSIRSTLTHEEGTKRRRAFTEGKVIEQPQPVVEPIEPEVYVCKTGKTAKRCCNVCGFDAISSAPLGKSRIALLSK